MTRALYRPGREPASNGDGLPRGGSPAALETRRKIEEALADPVSAARVSRPFHANDDQYEQLVGDRMRSLSMAERIDMEIELTQRFKRLHTSDYDPLKY